MKNNHRGGICCVFLFSLTEVNNHWQTTLSTIWCIFHKCLASMNKTKLLENTEKPYAANTGTASKTVRNREKKMKTNTHCSHSCSSWSRRKSVRRGLNLHGYSLMLNSSDQAVIKCLFASLGPFRLFKPLANRAIGSMQSLIPRLHVVNEAHYVSDRDETLPPAFISY